MYKYTPLPGLVPIEGLPQRDLTEAEFKAIAEAYESTFGTEGKGALLKSGWYVRVKDKEESGGSSVDS